MEEKEFTEENTNIENDAEFVDDAQQAGDDVKEQNATAEEIDYKSQYIQVMADFDNYRRRALDSISTARTDGLIDAISAILPSLDSFEQAMNMIQDENTKKGIEYIQKNIFSSIESLGVQKIDASGQFDPNYHNAISMDETADVESNYIVKELISGYTYKDKVIRYAQVIVKK